MNIYELDRKGLMKVFRQFHNSLYGRTVFFFAYFIPFALFACACLLAIIAIFAPHNTALINFSLSCLAIFFPNFILGNIYFYSEIRKFCQYKESEKHTLATKK